MMMDTVEDRLLLGGIKVSLPQSMLINILPFSSAPNTKHKCGMSVSCAEH